MYEETLKKNHLKKNLVNLNHTHETLSNNVNRLIEESWLKIAPFWPLKNLVAVNPLQGLEDYPIEKAMLDGAVFFEQTEFPTAMSLINKETIKWLQAFFDEGQATINMPLRKMGLYKAWKKLAYFDTRLHDGDTNKQKWLLNLPESPESAISQCLLTLKIPQEEQSLFLTLMLTTLPGWAAHIKYRTHWAAGDLCHPHPVSGADYIAIRLIITSLLWEEAAELLEWHEKLQVLQIKKPSPIIGIQKSESEYLEPLLNKLALQKSIPSSEYDAQIIFCIDVRSEPFRRALESIGNYETFGYAGFFGVPARIQNTTTTQSYDSCPVLLKPKHTIHESPCSSEGCVQDHKGYQKLNTIKALYQSLKYNFTTPLGLIELIGLTSGFWMALRTLFPMLAIQSRRSISHKIRPSITLTPSLETIDISDQCTYAESVLKAIGLTKKFSSLVILCGHGSVTENNAYATALDCGACGGHHGASNAKILAKILNTDRVREYLNTVGISIPKETQFIAAQHNTTTDEVDMYTMDTKDDVLTKKIDTLKHSLIAAGRLNSSRRSKDLGFDGDENKSAEHTKLRGVDWAQVRPEWGLARNASFIVAPREISKKIDLEGRAFLHSYDYLQDPDGSILTGILTAPMVVAQWINMQYLFSTIDNVAYGSGSKITKNIAGKIGVMQGNASDLMNGLPLQSVYQTDRMAYHKPVRLMVIVYTTIELIDDIIKKQSVLKKLFSNGWVLLTCIDPKNNHNQYFLNRDLTWERRI